MLSRFRFISNSSNGSTRFLFPGRARFSAIRTPPDLRARLLEQLKNSLKARDPLASNTIRSILSEVYSADKVSNGKKVDSSAIATFVRKACTRRLDSANQFSRASRPDLAAKERQEADLLAGFLPPLLPEAEIDLILKGVISEQLSETQIDPRKSIGKVFKTFYAQVDRASVDPDLVRRRAEALLAAPPFA